METIPGRSVAELPSRVVTPALHTSHAREDARVEAAGSDGLDGAGEVGDVDGRPTVGSRSIAGDHVGTTDCIVTGGTGRLERGGGHFTATTLTTNVAIVGTTMSGDLEGTADGVVSFG